MKTFIADIIPRIQKYSLKLDNLTLLTNQHWVVVDEIANSKTVYIFRQNNELLICKNGRVEIVKWEYIDNSTILIRLKDESLLFRNGFFDDNILALKIDGREEYAFLANETKFDRELNSYERIIDFLQRKYIAPKIKNQILEASHLEIKETAESHLEDNSISKIREKYKTDKGELEVEHSPYDYPCTGNKVYLDGNPAPDGVYKLGFMWNVHIKDGKVSKTSFLGIPN